MQFESKLHQFANQAKARDSALGASKHPLFDNTLFRCQARFLAPYVEETLALYRTIFGNTLETKKSSENTLLENKSSQGGTSKIMTPEKAAHLSEQLVAQINAITVELSANRPNPATEDETEKNELLKQLEQHKEWEYRLQQLVSDNEHTVFEKKRDATTNEVDITAAIHTLHAARQRLLRCQAAKQNIEAQLLQLQARN